MQGQNTMEKVFNKNERPIYGWRLLPDGTIKDFDPVYEYNVWPNEKYTYHFMQGKSKCWLKGTDIDKFMHGRYYSFDNDRRKAVAAICKHYELKVKATREELDRLEDIMEKLNHEAL